MYTYECENCGERFEAKQSFSDSPLTVCPTCEGKIHRVIQPVGVVFKGSGFYVNDSRGGKQNLATPGTKKEETKSAETASASAESSSSTSSSSSSEGGTAKSEEKTANPAKESAKPAKSADPA
jgi:putative FmdB family regulatory protein